MTGPDSIAAAALLAAAALGGTAKVLDRASWAREMRAAIAAELPQLNGSARLLVLAHAAFESGWGTARAARQGNNVFNITAGSAWSGAKWVDVGGDTDATGARITQTWRIYDSLRGAVRDYWAFLGPGQNRGRYVSARAALELADLPLFTARLYAAGYFELDPTTYAQRLEAVRTQARALS